MDPADRESARLVREARERRRFNGYHTGGLGFVVVVVAGYALFATWANASIWGWGSSLVLLLLIPGFFIIRQGLRNRASNVVRHAMDPGRGFTGPGVDR